MTEISLQFDTETNDIINYLMIHYKTKSKAKIISKAIATLKLVAYIDERNGEIIARKDNQETRLTFR